MRHNRLQAKFEYSTLQQMIIIKGVHIFFVIPNQVKRANKNKLEAVSDQSA